MYMKKAKITLSLLLSAVLLVCALAPMSYASVAGANEAVKLAMTDAGADYEKYESDKFLPYMNKAKYKENLNENWEAGNYEVSFIFKGVQYNYVVDAKTWEFISKEEINVIPYPADGNTEKISKDAAEAIALAYIGNPDDFDHAKSVKVKDTDYNGNSAYSVEFQFDKKSDRTTNEYYAIYEYEYSFVVDAFSGEILKADYTDISDSFINKITSFFNKLTATIMQIFGVFA